MLFFLKDANNWALCFGSSIGTDGLKWIFMDPKPMLLGKNVPPDKLLPNVLHTQRNHF